MAAQDHAVLPVQKAQALPLPRSEERLDLRRDGRLEGRQLGGNRRSEPGSEPKVRSAEPEEDAARPSAVHGPGQTEDVGEREAVARGWGRAASGTDRLEGESDDLARWDADDAVDEEEGDVLGKIDEIDGIEPGPSPNLDPLANLRREPGESALDGDRAEAVVAALRLPADDEADPPRRRRPIRGPQPVS